VHAHYDAIIKVEGMNRMSFYVYQATERMFLAEDEHTWTPDFFSAAGFASRVLADDIATRELGEGHGAYVLDDGVEA
jgi:hypothetical protein